MDEPAEDEFKVHVPFTKEENLQQLSELDRDITNLLVRTSEAMRCLTTTKAADAPSDGKMDIAGDSQNKSSTEAFKTAMDAFLSTLHSVDVRLKRQIMALEEAGIINLKRAADGHVPESGAAGGISGRDVGGKTGAQSTPASLEPDGVGNIGSLEVGWLNSRSGKVERDMEAELWERARKQLAALGGASAEVGTAHDDGDETMAQD